MPPPSVTQSVLKPPLLGQRYVIRRRIGRGGTSSVYLAFDLRLRAWRAAKVMHAESVSDAELCERFVREAAAMANLEHPNVARVSDVGAEAPVPFLVMEWLEGGSAANWVMEHGPMPLELALDVAMAACEALAFVHGHGVIHRDVNPRNLLFDRFGTCKLTDFGIAQVRETFAPEDLDQHATQIGTVMGTEAYMAPEQKRDSSHVDLRVDVYGVGATLYSLLVGRLPPDHAIAGRNDPRLRKVSQPVAAILARACADHPRDRYGDARELHEALTRLRSRSAPVDTKRLVAVTHDPLPATAPRTLSSEDYKTLTELLASGACQGFYEPTASTLATAPSRRVSSGVAMLMLMVIAFGLTFGIGTGAVLALLGARSTSEARLALVRSESRYVQAALRHQERVLVDLTNAGIDPSALAAAFESLDHASDNDLSQAVSSAHQVMLSTTKTLPSPPVSALAMLDALARAKDDHEAKRALWQRASHSVTGQIAVRAGLVSGE